MPTINLHRQPDGTLVNWGRHWRDFGKEGHGPAYWYHGEALKVMQLVLKYMERSK